jgi:ubiquinone/menaquinone biosynthesis C-methylase UbiE
MSTWTTEKKRFWQTDYDCTTYERDIGGYALNVDSSLVKKWLSRQKGIVLDVPCGAGRFSSLAEKLHHRVVGADISFQMLSANRNAGRKELVQCDAFQLPFNDSSFDIVIMMRLLFHYKKPERILKEINRVTKRGGTLICDTLNSHSIRHSVQTLLTPFRAEGGKLWFCSSKAMQKLLLESGFKTIEKNSKFILPTRAYRFLPGFTVWFIDKCEIFWPKRFRGVSYWLCKKI